MYKLRVTQGCQPKELVTETENTNAPWRSIRSRFPCCKCICLNYINCHNNYITTGLRNLLWFSFLHPPSKTNRSQARQARQPACKPRARAQTKDPTASWLARQRNWCVLGSGKRPCLSIWTHEYTPHTNLKTQQISRYFLQDYSVTYLMLSHLASLRPTGVFCVGLWLTTYLSVLI